MLASASYGNILEIDCSVVFDWLGRMFFFCQQLRSMGDKKKENIKHVKMMRELCPEDRVQPHLPSTSLQTDSLLSSTLQLSLLKHFNQRFGDGFFSQNNSSPPE